MLKNTKVKKLPQGLRTTSAVHKFLLFKLQQQNTFWSFITDAPHFLYGGNFPFSKEMQEKAREVRLAIEAFERALERREADLKGESP